MLFEVNGSARNDDHFVFALERAVGELPASSPLRELNTLDLSSTLAADKYFRLDDHLNPHGHRAVADALLPFLQ